MSELHILSSTGSPRLRRQPLGLAVVAACLALLAPALTSTAHAATSRTAKYQITDPVPLSNTTEVEEGLADKPDGTHIVAFKVTTTTSRFMTYSPTGQELSRTAALPIGHANGIALTPTGKVYAVSSGPGVTNPAIKLVDLAANPPVIVQSLPFPSLTIGAVLAYDYAKDQLVVIVGPTGGPYRLSVVALDGTVLRQIAFPNLGITQGLQVVGDKLALLTTNVDRTKSKITTLDMNANVLDTIQINIAGEPEGLAVHSDGHMIFGMTKPNRLYEMIPDNCQRGYRSPGC